MAPSNADLETLRREIADLRHEVALEETPVAELIEGSSYLDGLTAHERAEEGRITQEVTHLYASFRPRSAPAPRARGPWGGFDKTWTHHEGFTAPAEPTMTSNLPTLCGEESAADQ